MVRRADEDQRGAGLVEYALLVALIAVVCIGAVTFLGTSGKGEFDKAGKGLSGVTRTCWNPGSGSRHITYELDDQGNATNVSDQIPGECP